MPDAFTDLLAILVDEQQPLTPAQLSDLSDLDLRKTRRLESIWRKIPTARRRSMLETFGELANERFELSFERINRFALHDPDDLVRQTAIENLWECCDPQLSETLLPLVDDRAALGVAASAAKALGQFVYLGELGELPEPLQRRIEECLLRASTEKQPLQLQLRAIESLGYSSRAEVEPLIKRAFASHDEEYIAAALLAMGRSANKRWSAQVLSALESDDADIRAQAAFACGELELREATPELLELLLDESPAVRHKAIWSLGQLGGKEAEAALSQVLEVVSDDEEAALIEDAIDHLAFVDSSRDLWMLNLDDIEED